MNFAGGLQAWMEQVRDAHMIREWMRGKYQGAAGEVGFLGHDEHALGDGVQIRERIGPVYESDGAGSQVLESRNAAQRKLSRALIFEIEGLANSVESPLHCRFLRYFIDNATNSPVAEDTNKIVQLPIALLRSFAKKNPARWQS